MVRGSLSKELGVQPGGLGKREGKLSAVGIVRKACFPAAPRAPRPDSREEEIAHTPKEEREEKEERKKERKKEEKEEKEKEKEIDRKKVS